MDAYCRTVTMLTRADVRPARIGAIAVVLLGGLVGCKSHEHVRPTSSASASGSATSSATPASVRPPTAEQRARAFLQTQIDAALRGDTPALVKTFSDDAVVLVPLASAPAEVTFFGIGDGFHGMQTTKASIATLIAGGTADAVWFYADVSTENEFADDDGNTKKASHTTRVVELVSAADDWRAVAGSFTESLKPQPLGANPEIEGATGGDGTLAKLVSGGATASMAPDALLVGPEEGQLATGPAAARDAIAGWKLQSLTLIPRPREVRTAHWGFVQGHLDQPRADKLVNRLAVQLVGVPKPDGNWQVVLVQYLAK